MKRVPVGFRSVGQANLVASPARIGKQTESDAGMMLALDVFAGCLAGSITPTCHRLTALLDQI